MAAVLPTLFIAKQRQSFAGLANLAPAKERQRLDLVFDTLIRGIEVMHDSLSAAVRTVGRQSFHEHGPHGQHLGVLALHVIFLHGGLHNLYRLETAS